MSNRPLIQPIVFTAPASNDVPAPRRVQRVRRDSGVVSRLSEEARRLLHELSRALVGQMNLKDAQRALRTAMSQEALARCNGSRRAAAALLGVDRRYVQRLADEGDTAGPDSEPPDA